MPKSTSASNSIVNLLLQGTAITGLATNATTSPLTNLYLALHTANPGVGGAQTTSEAAYAGYARVAVPRSSSGWGSASGGTSALASAANFPAATAGAAGSETEGYYSIGTAATGAGLVLWSGPISPTISVGQGVQPQLSTATTVTEA